jgi:hypothetical protein
MPLAAAALAAGELKVAPSATALTTMALRAALEAAVIRVDGNPLAADPERIRRAAAEIAATHPQPEPEDVLLWAEARAFPP